MLSQQNDEEEKNVEEEGFKVNNNGDLKGNWVNGYRMIEKMKNVKQRYKEKSNNGDQTCNLERKIRLREKH